MISREVDRNDTVIIVGQVLKNRPGLIKGTIIYEYQFVVIAHQTTTRAGNAAVKLMDYLLFIVARDYDRQLRSKLGFAHHLRLRFLTSALKLSASRLS